MHERNIFYGYDEPAMPIAPCRSIPITAAVLREEARKQAERNRPLAWTIRPSPNPRHPQTSNCRTLVPAGPRVCRTCGHRPRGCVCATRPPRLCAECATPLAWRTQGNLCHSCITEVRKGAAKGVAKK